MKLSISHKNAIYELNFERITQLCGTSFYKKNFIINSLLKHFSSSKYLNYETDMIENIKIDNEVPGRKYFEVYYISYRKELISSIKSGKTSLITEYIKSELQKNSFQQELQEIEAVLDSIFDNLNRSLFSNSLNIRFEYDTEKMFDIIQKSNVLTTDFNELETLSNYELLKNYLLLLEKMQQKNPQKILIILDNIDHLIEYPQYLELFTYLNDVCKKYDCWFIISTSIEGFVYIDELNIESINIINDIIYSLPSLEKLHLFIENYYPCYISPGDSDIVVFLKSIIHKIGKDSVLINQKSDVFLKLVHKTLCIDTKIGSTVNQVEKSFLEA